MAENKGIFNNPPTIKNGRPAVITPMNLKGDSKVKIKPSNVKVTPKSFNK